VTGRAFSNKILAALVFVNVFMWAPSVIYKFDWTNRNFEVTEHLVVYLSETEAKKVVIENSSQSQWDAKMLIIYSKHIADQNVDFYCWWDIADTTLYDPSCPMYLNDKKTALRLNLGSVDSERTATLAYDGKVLWQYESLWTKWVPSKLRDVLAPHYNIW
jgi:hypothetical protein